MHREALLRDGRGSQDLRQTTQALAWSEATIRHPAGGVRPVVAALPSRGTLTRRTGAGALARASTAAAAPAAPQMPGVISGRAKAAASLVSTDGPALAPG